MFLTQAELKTASVPEVVHKAINGDNDIVELIIEESIDIMKTYLHGQYDTEVIFSAVGDERDLSVLKYLKDIVVYEIYTRKTTGINEVALKRYEEAMLWLQHVAKGVISPDLPKPEGDQLDEGEGDGIIKYGSNSNYINRF